MGRGAGGTIVLLMTALSLAALAAAPSAALADGGRAADLAGALRDRGIPPLLVTGLVAMLPIFELRGAIPVGAALFKLDIFRVYAVSVVFNLVPIMPILLFLNPIRAALERKGRLRGLSRFFERRARANRRLIERFEEVGLALFVAVPLPITGAWTGALIAAVMGLSPGKSFLYIAAGVGGAGLVVSLLTMLGVTGIILGAGLLAAAAAFAVASALGERKRRAG